MKIGITNIGGSIKFKESSIKRLDGTLEYFNLIYALLRNDSISNIYILQKSDWKKLTFEQKKKIDPKGILIDVYSNEKFNWKNSNHTTLYENIKNENINCIIGFLSYGLTRVNIPNIIKKQKEEGYYGCLESTLNYAGNQVWMLNESKIPWFAISNDPRYMNEKMIIRDLINLPLKIISQYNYTSEFHYIKEYPNQGDSWNLSTKIVDLFYSQIEKLNLLNEDIINENKETLFSIASMQSSAKDSKKDYRFEELKKWVCNSNKDNISIFGRWDEYYSSQYPEYFKGLIPYQEVDIFFSKTKYTLIIPIGKNWVTSKWCEMLRLGVIPFFHPDYDTQFNVFPENSFLRVKTPEEMWNKIDLLEKEEGARDKLIKTLQEKYLSNIKNGEFIFKMLNSLFLEFNLNLSINEKINDSIKIESNELF